MRQFFLGGKFIKRGIFGWHAGVIGSARHEVDRTDREDAESKLFFLLILFRLWMMNFCKMSRAYCKYNNGTCELK